MSNPTTKAVMKHTAPPKIPTIKALISLLCGKPSNKK
jgi:hypothetical protein